MAVSEPPEAKTTRPWQRSQALLDEAAAKRAAFEALSAKSVDDTKEQRVAEEAAAKRAAFEAQVAAEKEKKAVIAEEMKAKGFTIVEAKPEPEPEPEVEKPVKKRGGFSLNFGFGGKKTVEAPQEVAEVKPAAVAKPPTPKPAAPPATKAAKPAPTPAAVEQTQSEGETPARAFERIMAPFYIPPAVAKARPELVEKYKSGAAPAPTAVAKAAPAKPAAPKPAAKVVKPAAKAAKPAPTSAAVEETQSEGETPARAFERIMAPFYIPPAVAKARPELVEKYKSGK